MNLQLFILLAPMIALLTMVWNIYRTHNKDFGKLQKEYEIAVSQLEYQRTVNKVILDAIIQLHQRHALTGVVVGGIVAGREYDSDIFEEIENKEKRDLGKKLNELKMFSSYPEQVLSACRKLSMESGNLDTLDLLVISRNEQDRIAGENLAIYESMLRDKLNATYDSATYTPPFYV